MYNIVRKVLFVILFLEKLKEVFIMEKEKIIESLEKTAFDVITMPKNTFIQKSEEVDREETEIMENKHSLFYKYPSIENTFHGDFLEKIKERGFSNIPYCITEKIHGSNSQLDYDCITGEFNIGKRSGEVTEGNAFYNLISCLEPIKEKMPVLAHYIKTQIDAMAVTIKLYGEVFGGTYPHKDVEQDKSALKVNKGVFYSNHNCWLAFDVAYTTTKDNMIHFLCGSEFFNACEYANIPTVPLLKIVNSLDEALAFPNNGESVVYKKYFLPKLENNIMEGVVIRPYKEDVWFGMTRLILKNKSEKFLEKKSEQKVNVQEEMPVNVMQAICEIEPYITESRVQNVISHYGTVTEKDIGKLIGLVSQDVLTDYKKDFGTLNLLDKTESKMVTRYLGKQTAVVVRKVVFEVLKWNI